MLPMNFKSRISLWFAAPLLFVSLVAAPAFSHIPIPPKKGEIGRRESSTPAPSFTLINQSGAKFRFNPAAGKFVLVTFVYTTCPDVCPLFTAKLASIQRELEQETRDDYLLLTITTDPARDTPAQMKAYAQAFNVDLRRWHFLTGGRKELAEVWKNFGVTVKELNNGQVQHTNLTTLIDPRGIRRVDYYGDKWQEKEILKDIARLSSSRRR
ncbi:MAG: redoxin domain-containing protein [Deltaproteobacteria bacterium]|nr:redoxin domain-containing protein [Deltaproteobacteria bacterium]